MFLERVLGLINEKGINKNKLLTDLNLGKNSFVNWDKRGTIPSGETLNKIAEYFNVSTDYLLGNTDIKKTLDVDAQVKEIAEKSSLLSEDDKLKVLDYMNLLIKNRDNE